MSKKNCSQRYILTQKEKTAHVAVNRLLRCIKPNGYGLPLGGRGVGAYSHLLTGTTGKNHGIQTNRRYRYFGLKILLFHTNFPFNLNIKHSTLHIT